MENHLYHPNMEGRACGLGWHTKRPASPYRNPRSRPPPPPSPLLFQASVRRLPCCREPDSKGWASAAGIIRSGNCSQGKFSEELTSDGWRRCGGGGWAKAGSTLALLAASEEARGKSLGSSARGAWLQWESLVGRLVLGKEQRAARALEPPAPELPTGRGSEVPSGCQSRCTFVPEISPLRVGGIPALMILLMVPL